MPSAVSIEMANAYLRQVNEQGQSLYQHLADLLAIIDQTNTDKQPINLESLSLQAKSDQSIKHSINQSNLQSAKQTVNQSVNPQWLKDQSKLMNTMVATTHTNYQSINQPINQTINQTINKTKAPLTDFRVQNIQSMKHLLSDSGLMIDCDAVQFALNQLAINLSNNQTIKQSVNLPINNVSFWGIIHGLTADYYVMECSLKPVNESVPQTNHQSADQPTKQRKQRVDQSEVRGAGVNQSIYFVSNTLVVSSDEINQNVTQPLNRNVWTMLPDCNAELLAKSRSYHRLVSGHLEASITGNPSFNYLVNQSVVNGVEAMYLRCQIARIQHSAFLAPKGSYTTVELEENPDVDESSIQVNNQTKEYVDVDPEWEGVDDSINELSSWTHIRGKILKGGRTTQWIEPEVEEDEESAANTTTNNGEEEEPEEEEEIPGLLSNIEDAETSLFTMRRVKQSINSGRHPHDATLVQSCVWPGAFSLAQAKQVINLYVGAGVKKLEKSFVPARMPTLQSEFNAVIVDEEEQPTDLLAEQADALLTVELQEDEEQNEDDEEGEEDEEDQ